jgi:hypothetical protein
MTQEDKQLLIKDLCARLPYGVKISPKEKDTGEYDKTSGSNYMYPDVISVEAFIPDGDNTRIEYGDWIIYLDNIQLYLRPMSSMTEEEKEVYINTFLAMWDAVDWLNSHHFDYCELIEKGLALEALDGMYKNE